MTKDYQQFTNKKQQGKCRMRSFNSEMALNNVYKLKRIQLTKHMQYCIQKYTTCTIQHSGILSYSVN